MARVVFAAQPPQGHLNPLLTIARQMRSDGHTIVFLTPSAPAKMTKVITDNGFSMVALRPAIATVGFICLPLTSGYLETFFAINLFFSGLLHYARTVDHVLHTLQPDVVVCDFAFPGACLAAESRGIPFVVIYHAGLSFRGPGIPPFGSGLPIGETWGSKAKLYRFLSDYLERSIAKALARTRKRLNLSPQDRDYPLYLLSPWLNLVLTAEASEAPRFPLPPTVFFIGPCFAGRTGHGTETFPFALLSPDKPKVYVSLGTVFNKKPKVYGKIIQALADAPYQVIVSAGKSYARLRAQSLPANVLLFDYVPQLELLPQVDVVISHGGNNTVNEALAAGKPLLILPVGGEQGDNASRVVYLGVGLRADLKHSTTQEIRTKVRRLIEEPTFRDRAQAIAASLSQTHGPVTAARFIAHLAASRQPIMRPPGYPLTVTRQDVPPWGGGMK